MKKSIRFFSTVAGVFLLSAAFAFAQGGMMGNGQSGTMNGTQNNGSSNQQNGPAGPGTGRTILLVGGAVVLGPVHRSRLAVPHHAALCERKGSTQQEDAGHCGEESYALFHFEFLSGKSG